MKSSLKEQQRHRRTRTGLYRQDRLQILSVFLICATSNLIVPRALSFSPQHAPFSRPPSETSSELYGVRASLRRKFSSAFRQQPAPDPQPPLSSSPPEESSTRTLTLKDTAVTATTHVLTHTDTDISASLSYGGALVKIHDDACLYSLPELDRDLNKLELEFRDKLEHFTRYTTRDILSLRDPRVRVIFRGIASSAYEPAVYRAFEVLFEDLFPLRVGGRVFYKIMKQLMIDSRREREEQVALVREATGLPEQIVEDSRLAFVSTAATMNGDSFLTVNQLADMAGLSLTSVEVLGFEDVEELLSRLDNDGKGNLSFVDLMTGLQQCAEETCSVEECNPAVVMRDILADLEQNPPQISEKLNVQKQVFSDRYDEMVNSFREWEDLVPQGEVSSLSAICY